MYRWWRISLRPLSPFLVAGRRITPNYYETLDYIPGRILKGAVARAILESYGGTPEDGSAAATWVGPELDESLCRPEWRNWVRSFSEILFSDATPFGAGRPPSTLLVCKNDPSHPPVDDLPDRFRWRVGGERPDDGRVPENRDRSCPVCRGRLERWKEGWRFPDGHERAGHSAHVQKRVFTRVELDDWRQTHRDGHLFSLAAGIPEAAVEGKAEPLIFQGWIRAPEDADLQLPKGMRLRVGAYVGVGLGLMEVEVRPEGSGERRGWTDRGDWVEATGDRSSIPVVLQGDCLYAAGCGTERITSVAEDRAAYAAWWKQRPSAIPAPDSLTVLFAAVQYESRYPFVAGQPGVRSMRPLWYWLGGSLFVFAVSDPSEAPVLVQWVEALCRDGVRSDVEVPGARFWDRGEFEETSGGTERAWTPVRIWSSR